MVLRFEVNQAEAFRQGVNVPKSTNHLDVDPAKLSQEERDLIADRLDGIDVCKLWMRNGELERCHGDRIVAKLPTYAALMEAIRQNQAEADKTLALHKDQAIARCGREIA